jgi:DNA-directed RNA polymerase subunit M
MITRVKRPCPRAERTGDFSGESAILLSYTRLNLVSSRYSRAMFCPECKTMLISSGGQLKCRKCGYIRKIETSDQMKTQKMRTENEIVIVEEEGQERTMPTIQIKCPKCENNLAIWWLRQLRAADESEVRFFRCTECGHTWRQYD